MTVAYAKPLRFALGQERWARTPTSLGAVADIEGAISQALDARAGEAVSIGVRVDPEAGSALRAGRSTGATAASRSTRR